MENVYLIQVFFVSCQRHTSNYHHYSLCIDHFSENYTLLCGKNNMDFDRRITKKLENMCPSECFSKTELPPVVFIYESRKKGGYKSSCGAPEKKGLPPTMGQVLLVFLHKNFLQCFKPKILEFSRFGVKKMP